VLQVQVHPDTRQAEEIDAPEIPLPHLLLPVADPHLLLLVLLNTLLLQVPDLDRAVMDSNLRNRPILPLLLSTN
jgi:hypothetical protein